MNVDISKTTHFLYQKTALNLNTKSVNPFIHLHPIHVKKIWFQRISGLVWTGDIN